MQSTLLYVLHCLRSPNRSSRVVLLLQLAVARTRGSAEAQEFQLASDHNQKYPSGTFPPGGHFDARTKRGPSDVLIRTHVFWYANGLIASLVLDCGSCHATSISL